MSPTVVAVTVGERTATEILIGPAVSAGEIVPARESRNMAVILTQPGRARTVADNIAESLEVPALVIELPDRDEAKTWTVVAGIQEQLAAMQLGRGDTVIGVGGGAVTDVAGFVAATWLRGVEAVYVPTTLLGAVDAAVGGKTGINLGGKNLVGAFAHPTRVTVDTDLLDELPIEIKREGWAEAIKTGFVGDASLVSLFETFGEAVPTYELVERSLRVKAAVVSEDFKEAGRRAILNFGHTIGHGVEFAAHMSHGHAVSVGMVAAATISKQTYGWDYPMADVLTSLGLPVNADAEWSEVERLVYLDKKRDDQGLRMVLLADIADPRIDYVTADAVHIGMAGIGLEAPNMAADSEKNA